MNVGFKLTQWTILLTFYNLNLRQENCILYKCRAKVYFPIRNFAVNILHLVNWHHAYLVLIVSLIGGANSIIDSNAASKVIANLWILNLPPKVTKSPSLQ